MKLLTDTPNSSQEVPTPARGWWLLSLTSIDGGKDNSGMVPVYSLPSIVDLLVDTDSSSL